MYSAFRRLRRVRVHAVRDIETDYAASALVARPKGHRRKVEEVLIFGCGLSEQLTPFKKAFHSYTADFFSICTKKILVFFKKVSQLLQNLLFTIIQRRHRYIHNPAQLPL